MKRNNLEKKFEHESIKEPSRVRVFIKKLLLSTSLISSACAADEVKNEMTDSTGGAQGEGSSTQNEDSADSNGTENIDENTTGDTEGESTGDTENETTGGMETSANDESATRDTEGETSTGEEINEAPEFNGPILATVEGFEPTNVNPHESGVLITTDSHAAVTFEIPVQDSNHDEVVVTMSFVGENNAASFGGDPESPSLSVQEVVDGEGAASFTLTPTPFVSEGTVQVKVTISDGEHEVSSQNIDVWFS